MPAAPLHAVLLAGGSGTRFWPASRRSRPKQFLAIGTDEPLLVATRRRLDPLVPDERVLVVTAASQAAGVRALLPGLGPDQVLAEPCARNTAAAVAWAALDVHRRDPGAVLAVLPADHVIAPAERFRGSLAAAADLAARQPVLVTFGVRPTHPATGYGYIELGERLSDSTHAVARFVEKPDAATAAGFLATGRLRWNAGMFVWSARTILAAFERHAPDVLAPLRDAAAAPGGLAGALAEAYADLPALPVDKAILERADNVRTIPIDYTWSDVGSWTSLPEVHAADGSGNCAVGGGALVAEDARGNVVYGEPGRLTALIGVEDLVVVHADGATLVCRKDRAQDVRRVVERLESQDPRWL